jgi:hypothetical protein
LAGPVNPGSILAHGPVNWLTTNPTIEHTIMIFF